jgi:hypothetical protein
MGSGSTVGTKNNAVDRSIVIDPSSILQRLLHSLLGDDDGNW